MSRSRRPTVASGPFTGRTIAIALALLVSWAGAASAASVSASSGTATATGHHCRCGSTCEGDCCCAPKSEAREKAMARGTTPPARQTPGDDRPCMGRAPRGLPGLPATPIEGHAGKARAIPPDSITAATDGGARLVPILPTLHVPPRRASRLDDPPEAAHAG